MTITVGAAVVLFLLLILASVFNRLGVEKVDLTQFEDIELTLPTHITVAVSNAFLALIHFIGHYRILFYCLIFLSVLGAVLVHPHKVFAYVSSMKFGILMTAVLVGAFLLHSLLSDSASLAGSVFASLPRGAWFVIILSLLSFNVIACMVRRLLSKKEPVGFVLIHLSILVIIAAIALDVFASKTGVMPVAPLVKSSAFFNPRWTFTVTGKGKTLAVPLDVPNVFDTGTLDAADFLKKDFPFIGALTYLPCAYPVTRLVQDPASAYAPVLEVAISSALSDESESFYLFMPASQQSRQGGNASEKNKQYWHDTLFIFSDDTPGSADDVSFEEFLLVYDVATGGVQKILIGGKLPVTLGNSDYVLEDIVYPVPSKTSAPLSDGLALPQGGPDSPSGGRVSPADERVLPSGRRETQSTQSPASADAPAITVTVTNVKTGTRTTRALYAGTSGSAHSNALPFEIVYIQVKRIVRFQLTTEGELSTVIQTSQTSAPVAAASNDLSLAAGDERFSVSVKNLILNPKLRTVYENYPSGVFNPVLRVDVGGEDIFLPLDTSFQQDGHYETRIVNGTAYRFRFGPQIFDLGFDVTLAKNRERGMLDKENKHHILVFSDGNAAVEKPIAIGSSVAHKGYRFTIGSIEKEASSPVLYLNVNTTFANNLLFAGFVLLAVGSIVSFYFHREKHNET